MPATTTRARLSPPAAAVPPPYLTRPAAIRRRVSAWRGLPRLAVGTPHQPGSQQQEQGEDGGKAVLNPAGAARRQVPDFERVVSPYRQGLPVWEERVVGAAGKIGDLSPCGYVPKPENFFLALWQVAPQDLLHPGRSLDPDPDSPPRHGS